MTNREIAKTIMQPDTCLHCVHLGNLMFTRAWAALCTRAGAGDQSALDIFQDIAAKLTAGFAAGNRETVAKAVLMLDEWDNTRGPPLDMIPRESLEAFTEKIKAEIAEMEAGEK